MSTKTAANGHRDQAKRPHPNAPGGLRARARELRLRGLKYKNTAAEYHGCLRVSVYRSSDLYRKIAGWATGVMSAA